VDIVYDIGQFSENKLLFNYTVDNDSPVFTLVLTNPWTAEEKTATIAHDGTDGEWILTINGIAEEYEDLGLGRVYFSHSGTWTGAVKESGTLIKNINLQVVGQVIEPWSAGNALEFDGVNDWVGLDSRITLSGDLTGSIWFFLDAFNTMVLSDQVAADRYVYIPNTTTIQFSVSSTLNYSFPAMSTGVWYHLMFTRSGTDIRMYVNGVESTTGVFSPALADMYFHNIGKFNTDILYTNGKIDDFYLWDGVVGTLGNAASLYNGGVPVDPESVIAAADYKYRFNSSSGIIAVDDGPNSNDGTLTNFADPDNNWVSR